MATRTKTTKQKASKVKPFQDALGRFKPGHVGNPEGRNRVNEANRKLRDQLLSGLPRVVESVRRQAIKGDMVAAGLVMRYALPPQKAVSPVYSMDTVSRKKTAKGKALEMMRLIESGAVPIEIGAPMAAVYQQMHRDEQLDDIQKRLEGLEDAAQ